MIIVEDDNYEKIKNNLTVIQEDMKSKGEYVPEVIYVNGNRQVSASNPEYHNPVLP